MRFIFSGLAACAVLALLTGCGSEGAEAGAPSGSENDPAAAPAVAETTSSTPDAEADAPTDLPPVENGVRHITWDALMPAGEDKVLAELMKKNAARAAEVEEGGPGDQMVQVGTFNVVEALDGEPIRMPGYVVPFNFNSDDEYSEFLLVPYFGACIHTPPPPPNQIVYVQTDEPVVVEDIWTPVWVEGEMQTARHEDEMGDAAYTLNLSKLEIYEGAKRRPSR